MDPFSIIVGTAGLVDAASKCLRLFTKHVGPSSLSSGEAESLKSTLYHFHATMSSFRLHLDLHDEDEARLASLERHLEPVIKQSLESFRIIREYLACGTAKKFLRGSKFDRTLEASRQSLDEANKLFSVAILADNQTLLLGVSRSVEQLKEGMDDIQSSQRDEKQENLYRSIRKWLGAQGDNNMNSNFHDRNLSARHPGSGEWLLEHATFQAWQKGSGDVQSRLWLTGSPGAGKSSLCSLAIKRISEKVSAPCLYYFYRFDDQSESWGRSDSHHDDRAASVLVEQLLSHFWRQDRRIVDGIGSWTEGEKNLTTLSEIVQVMLESGFRYAREKGEPSSDSANLYVFLDGLDENGDSRAVDDILKLIKLPGAQNQVHVKLWIRSRDVNSLRQYLGECPTIHCDGHAEPDVKDFLTKMEPELSSVIEGDHKINDTPLSSWILEHLQARAKGNFWYAKLMIQRLNYEGTSAFSMEDIQTLVTSSIPSRFEEMYRHIFRQYQEDQHKYISLVFSLIAFARRPLHLKELREAMMLSMSDPAKGLDPLRVPMKLQRLFAPLIEMIVDSSDPTNPLCCLCHSTVHEFLTTNPNVLCAESHGKVPFAYSISAAQIGDLCLRYLSQRSYAGLIPLPRNNYYQAFFVESGGATEHGLLPYCAKYWNTHLDDLEPTPDLLAKFSNFLQSTNFQTLLQVQSMFVRGQFSKFLGRGSSFLYRRAFPRWFDRQVESSEVGDSTNPGKYHRDYQHFLHEWGYFLEHGSCFSLGLEECRYEDYWGEVDRCLSGILGPANFLCHLRERYPSFMLSDAFDYRKSNQFVVAEAVLSNSKFALISSPSKEIQELSLEIWDLSATKKPARVSVTPLASPGHDCEPTAMSSTAFSAGARSLRRANLFSNIDGANGAVYLDETEPPRHLEPISVDFEKRGDMIVLARRNLHRKRRRRSSGSEATDPRESAHSSDNSDSESSQVEDDDGSDIGASTMEDSDDDDESDAGVSTAEDSDDESESELSSLSEDENSAYETCSEGSTDAELDCLEDETSDDDSDTDDVSQLGTDFDTVDSDEEEDQEVRANIRMTSRQPSGPALELEGENLSNKNARPTYPGMPDRFRDPKDLITATIAVYDVGSNQSRLLFHYEHSIPAMIYHSPPAIHPTKPLLVWPLGGGEVLFADYIDKTYFVRAVMPTTRDTRHICMKAHFSPCGNYLHIVSLEGRAVLANIRNPRSADKKIKLALFLTTHRLSERKTTRSPPTLRHKVKLYLGQFAGFSLAKLPFTFTWDIEHLYFSISSKRLKVFRINLFQATGGAPPVAVPRLSIMLPHSASRRQVHYLPGAQDQGPRRSVVLIGSYDSHCGVQLKHKVQKEKCLCKRGKHNEFLEYPCPPVGFYVDEDRDLDGWTPADKKSVVHSGNRFRDGNLVRKTEFFNWEEDVDLEGICAICSSPLTPVKGRVRG